MTEPVVNAFNWRVRPSEVREKAKESYPQKDYYHRKKLGLTGTRQNPDRQWRKRSEPCYFDTQGEADRTALMGAVNA